MVPWTEDPDRLQSGVPGVGQDLATKPPPPPLMAQTSLVAQTVKNPPTMQETQIQSLGQEGPRRREWQPTPVFLPGESHRQRSLVSYSPWDGKESDTTEVNISDLLGGVVPIYPVWL